MVELAESMGEFVMRWIQVVACTLTIALVSVTTEATALELDAEKSKIEFVGTKPGGKHDGGFKKFASSAKMDPSNPLSGSLSIKIETASLWSDNPKLTNHLKNPDFFNVRKFPEITFESVEMLPGESRNEGFVKGKLTMLGKTSEVKVPIQCDVSGSGCTLTADFSIDRTKWGMDYGQGKVDNKVSVKATLVFKP